MSTKQLSYYFNYIDSCNMCASKTDTHKVLGKRLNGSQGKNPSKKIGITTTVVQCSECGLIYSNPQPVPFDIQDHYGIPPENYWTDNYFVVNDKYFVGEIWRLNEIAPIKKGMKSLDIGAGLGYSMIALAKAGFDTYGFEPSKPFYERAISKMNISPDKLKLGQIENMEYPENNFDFITFGAVLEHLYDPAKSIAQALKWLKPGGIIQIEVPSSDWFLHKLINIFFKLRGSDYVGNLSPMHDPFHLHEFTLKSFEELAKKNNYEIVFHQYYVCKTYMPKVVDYFLKPYLNRTNKGMQLCVWLRKK
jgi:ubiquinone/menaquinone biosynthesis C-methylase UbiE